MNDLIMAILIPILLTGTAYTMAELFIKIFKIDHPKNTFFVYFIVFIVAVSFVPLTIAGLSNSNSESDFNADIMSTHTEGPIRTDNMTKSGITSKITPIVEQETLDSTAESTPSRFLLEISWYDLILEPTNHDQEKSADIQQENPNQDRSDQKAESTDKSSFLAPLSLLPPFVLMVFILFFLAIVFVCYQLFLGKSRYLQKINAVPSKNSYLNALIDHLSDDLQIKKPKIYVYKGAPNAFVLGYPAMLVVSDQLIKLLTEKELTTTLRHELAHIKNHDILLKAFVQATRILCFYNPFIHHIAGKIFNKRELIADKCYNSVHEDKISFMEALIKIADHSRLSQYTKSKKTPVVSVSLLQLTSTHPTLSDRFVSLFKHCQKKTIITIVVSLIILIAQGSALVFTKSYLSPDEGIKDDSEDLITVEEQYIVEDVTYTTVFQDNQRYQGKMVHKTLYNIVSFPPFEQNSNIREIVNHILLKYYQEQQAISAF